MRWGSATGSRIARPRLTDRLVDSGVAALIAPGGYGKSMLAEELAQRLGSAPVVVEISARSGQDDAGVVGSLRTALARAGLRSLAHALESANSVGDAADVLTAALADREDPLLLVLDEVQEVADEPGHGLRALAFGLPRPHRALFMGQRLPGWLGDAPLAGLVGPRELAFDTDEVMAIARATRRSLEMTDAAALVDATGGWPAAVVLVLESGMAVDLDRSLGVGLNEVVDRLMEQSTQPIRAQIARLCSVPVLSAPVAEALAGRDGLNRLLESGIPVRERPDGWLEVPAPIRAAAARRAKLDSAQLLAVAREFFDAGRGPLAVNLLVERGALEELAQALEQRPWQELQALDAAELRSIVSVMPGRILDAHPQLLLSVSRAASAAGQITWRSELLERAAASPVLDSLPALRRSVDADRAAAAMLTGDTALVERLARSVLDGAGEDELSARARALDALGRAREFERTPGAMAEAEQLLSQAVVLARMAGERELLGAILLALGYGLFYAKGDLESAATHLREAADVAPTSGRRRASILTFLSEVLHYGGQLDEAEALLREVSETGHRLRDQGLLGYHAWVKAAIASLRADRESLTTWLANAERHPGDWFGHPTGIEFLADAARMWGRLGDASAAAAYLSRVHERCASDEHDGVDQIALLARADFEARFGDGVAADGLLEAALSTEQLPMREAWRIHLLRGFAALRGGDGDRAASHAARAFEEAAALEMAHVPAMHEPAAVEALLPVVRGTRSSGVRSVAAAEPSYAVRVLGGFAVTAHGRPAEPPPGRPRTLVKLLAVAGRTVSTDEVLEVLWPEVDPEVGRARLRNVLARIRASSGELVQRAGDGLALAAGVVVDAVVFEREARAALAASDDAQVALARRALGRYAGELLPADRYEEWTVAARERLARLHLALLDALAAAASRGGDIDEALRLLSEALTAAPLDEHRYERAARLALEHGRRQRALELVEQGRAALSELGVEPSDGFAEISRQLR